MVKVLRYSGLRFFTCFTPCRTSLMTPNMQNKFKSFRDTEDKQFQKLNDIVIDSIEEEKLISEKVYEFDEHNLTFGNKLSDKIAEFGGSWKFVLSFIAITLFWMGINVYLLARPFDPYPFILLNLVLSSIAALQAPIIMMSQNRKEEKDRQRSLNDYMVNLKAEIEVRNLHQKLDLLMSEQMKSMFEIQQLQLDLLRQLGKVRSSNKES